MRLRSCAEHDVGAETVCRHNESPHQIGTMRFPVTRARGLNTCAFPARPGHMIRLYGRLSGMGADVVGSEGVRRAVADKVTASLTGRNRLMGIILLVLLLALILGGLGFAIHILWWITLVILAVLLIGLLPGPPGGGGRRVRRF